LGERNQDLEPGDVALVVRPVIFESLIHLRAETVIWHPQASPAGSKEDELENRRSTAQMA
jgi:hypothetical protein